MSITSDTMGDNRLSNNDTVNSVITFDNLTILKEFSNIADLVRDEDFLKTVPKSKVNRIKWVPMFKILKQDILNEMVQEISTMWEYHDMPKQLDILENQREKFAVKNPYNKSLWRPLSTNINNSLKSAEVAILRKQKNVLESLAKEYEERVTKHKKTLAAKRSFLKCLQMDIQKYQKKNEQLLSNICAIIDNHKNFSRSKNIFDENDIDNHVWSDIELQNKGVI
ncbi:uncharacterized protein LOC126974140 [Leptidea sinapis]|uniref:uncharacterized protein LOC126974140 n=1 Tax=Leptidea sinapis TaxID=189913 RepID=UPI002122A6D9|nr:uncharacterized protein LOC126974140 [Leptidea sinapis]